MSLQYFYSHPQGHPWYPDNTATTPSPPPSLIISTGYSLTSNSFQPISYPVHTSVPPDTPIRYSMLSLMYRNTHSTSPTSYPS